MGRESTNRINVYCKKGHLLFKNYRKVGGGTLLKCYEDEIGKDFSVHNEPPSLEEIIYCGQCEPPLAVAVVKMIHGRVAFEVKHGGIRKVVT